MKKLNCSLNKNPKKKSLKSSHKFVDGSLNLNFLQIKRMLVNQRGFIVESLRQLVQSNSEFLQQQQNGKRDSEPPGKCTKCSNPDIPNSIEQDRTLGRTFVDYGDRKSGLELEPESNSGRLCPMCEAVFPNSVSNEDFEQHVMEHFNFDDSETLVYMPHDS